MVVPKGTPVGRPKRDSRWSRKATELSEEVPLGRVPVVQKLRRNSIDEENISAEQSEEKQKVGIQKTHEHKERQGDTPETEKEGKEETYRCR